MRENPFITVEKSNTTETIFDKAMVKALFEALGINSACGISITEKVEISPYNKKVLIRIPNDSCSGESDILLNFKQGQPTVEQVFNTIYKHKSECKKRIITFTGGDVFDDKYNPSADVGTVKYLVDNMNRFNLNLYLVPFVADSTASTTEYEVLAAPPEKSEFSKSQCPSIEKFTEAEFWNVFFWGYDNWTMATPFEYGFDSESKFDVCYPVGDMAITLEWTGEGALIRIEDSNENNRNELDAIWSTCESDILAMFKGCDIEVMIRAGVVIKFKVTVLDKPIGDLAGIPWREKRHYAGLIWSKFMQCYEFMERALQDVAEK